MIFVSNCPALPTNGSPCKSSSAPGASPTNISGESISPTPKTTLLRELANAGHFWQTSARWRNSVMAATLAGPDKADGAGATGVAFGAGSAGDGAGRTE